MFPYVLLALIVNIVILYFTYIYVSNKEYRKKISKFKSVPYLPIFGHAFRIGRTKEEILPSLKKMWEDTGKDKFVLRMGPIDQVIITKSQDLEVILSSYKHLNKNFFYTFIDDLINKSLLTVEKERWRPLRKFLNTGFTNKFLESNLDVYKEEEDNFINNLTTSHNEDVNIAPIVQHAVIKSISKIVIGFDSNSCDDFEEYMSSLQLMFSLTNRRVFSAWKTISFLYKLSKEGRQAQEYSKFIYNTTAKLIEMKRKEIQENSEGFKTKNKLSMLDTYLSSEDINNVITPEQLNSELTILVHAGNDTTAIVTSFSIYCLAIYPEVQKLALEEQLSLTAGNLRRPISYEDLKDMKYLDCVIKEAMRIYTPVPIFGRKVNEDVTLPDGTVLPSGCNIMIVPYFTHRDPEVFTDPEKFDPNRFIVNPPTTYQFAPFSAGPRNCIGYRMGMTQAKYWVASVLRHAELLPPVGNHPNVITDPLLKSSTGINVQIRKRKL